ncbi:hypothetical protein OUZ56_033619 [Daphnia magna]|uniref:Uncharacterized protein n=1 Tax=Daphnia magna TaxID=35525 RepID=A0ABQ9Z9H4_9CRUS|nr:hypothetical protein OUZ56_018456 [Daphnia magna]KAK4017800.1 hypothetical protein OUZ56_033619 [Daphnia magna]
MFGGVNWKQEFASYSRKYKLIISQCIHIEYKSINSKYHCVFTFNTINGAAPSWLGETGQERCEIGHCQFSS